MTKNEIIEFLSANPACYLASVEGDKPRVRGILLYRADEHGLLFHTGKMKDLHRQLQANPNVELCFTNGDMQKLVQVRVKGKAELVEDIELKKEIVQARPFMQPWVEKFGYDPIAVYRVSGGRAIVWTFETNFAPKQEIEL